MRVAIVTHSVVTGDGQGRVNYELARHLRTRGVAVDLVADRVAPELVDDMGCTWHPVHPGFERVDLLKVMRFARQADRLLSRIAPTFDVVMACGMVTTHPHTINVAHFVHGTWLDSPYHPSRMGFGPRAWYQWVFSAANARWEQQTFAQAGRVVAVSEQIRDDLIAIGVAPDRITVIPNGVDTDEFAPGPADRDALGLPPRVPLALFVGDIQSPIKNLGTILRALADAPDVHLVVAGALRQSPYPALAASLGVDDRVHFLGFRRDIPDLMRAADFFVFPSRCDSFGLVVLEAMASGLPVVTTRTVGAAPLVSPDCGVVLPDPNDTNALAHELRILAGAPARRERMGRTARETALDHGWKQMSMRYLDLFERCRVDAPVRPDAVPSAVS